MVQYASLIIMLSTFFYASESQNYKLLGHFEMIGRSTLFHLIVVGLFGGFNPKREKSCGIGAGSFLPVL